MWKRSGNRVSDGCRPQETLFLDSLHPHCNEKEEQAYIRALQKGWHLVPDGSDDTHGPNWGTSRAWTGILAPGLSRSNIWDALTKRHVYSTLDRNCRLSFEVCGAVMGDVVAKPVEEVEISVVVKDPDAADTVAKIELFEDGEVVDVDEPAVAPARWSLKRKVAAGEHFYFVKATQADGDRIWSAPVWVTVADK
jgi:hypothetical protein